MKPRALLVEDHPMVQKVHKAFLNKMGCEVDVAENGTQAIAMYKNNYHFILLDINLPDMSGLEVSKMIRNDKMMVPIIALTAYSRAEIESACFASGINYVIIKPVIFEQLKELLQDILSGQMSASM